MTMKWLMLLFIPALCAAQEFQFRQEFDTIPVIVDGYQLPIPWTGGIAVSSPALCDIDADMDLDLFIGEYSGKLQFYENAGTAQIPDFTFTSLFYDSIYLEESRSNPCLGDLDGDGDEDLVIGDIDGWVHYYRNTGTIQNPEFQWVTNELVPVGPPWCLAPALVDIDADGDLDLIGGWQQLTYYRNDGTPQNYCFTLVTSNFANAFVSGNASPTFCDIDADGDFDLFIGDSYGRVHFYRNSGTPQQYAFTLESSPWLGIDVGDYAAPEFCDLDGDGDYDLILGKDNDNSPTPPGALHYWENLGTPQSYNFVPVTQQFLTFDAGVSTEADLADIDADGDLDLFFLTNACLGWMRNSGTAQNPVFTLEAYDLLMLSQGSCTFLPLDRDPYPDLVIASGWGGTIQCRRSLWQGGQLSLPFLSTQDLGLVINCLTAGDVDGDGTAELLLGGFDTYPSNGVLALYENQGSASSPYFVLQTENWLGLVDELQWLTPSLLPELTDVDGDGDLDLLFLHLATTTATLFLYENTGTAQNPQMTLVSQDFLGLPTPDPPMVSGGDLDSDGDVDFIAGGYYGGLRFYRNTTGDTSSVSPYTRPRPQRVMDLALSPQPGNPTTSISFQLPVSQEVDLAIYNLLGARVATLASGRMAAGSYLLPWESSGYASGIYFVRLATPTETLTRKLVILQ